MALFWGSLGFLLMRLRFSLQVLLSWARFILNFECLLSISITGESRCLFFLGYLGLWRVEGGWDSS